MRSSLQRPYFSPAEKFLWGLIENEKYEIKVESEFLVDMSSRAYITTKVADRSFYSRIKTIEIGTYKILSLFFSPYMDFMHPLIDLTFLYEKESIDINCYPKSLKRHCKFSKTVASFR